MDHVTNHRSRSIRSNESGATMLEFAFVAPIFFLMILAILEFSFMFHQRSIIEEATRTAGRIAITVSNSGQSANDAASLDTLLRTTLSNVGINTPTITTRVFESLAAAGEVSGGTTSNDPVVHFGAPGDLVRYRVTHTYNFITPIASMINGFDSSLTLTSTVFTVNETL